MRKERFQKVEESVKPLLAQLKAATTEDAVLDILWCSSLFQGMGSYEEVYESVQGKLEAMWADKRTHRELAADAEFALGKCFPMPLFRAAANTCLKNGWHAESFLLSLLNNIPFCEHRATRITPGVGKEVTQLPEVPDITSVAPPPLDSEQEGPPKKRKKREDKEETSDEVEARELHDGRLQEWLKKVDEMYGSDGLLDVKAGDYVHSISPGIPVMLAGPTSSRKSSQCDFARFLIQARLRLFFSCTLCLCSFFSSF